MYIVTGGAGFIGSALVGVLNQMGIDRILVVDDLGDSEKWKNLSNKQIVDYLHKDQFLRLIEQGAFREKTTACLHMGACSSTTESNAEFMMQNNYRYSKALAEWAIETNCRLIYASSAATYGDGALGFSDDCKTVPCLRPLNVYGLSKQLFDLWALQSGAIKHIVGLKFFNVYGPNEYHKGDMRSVVHKAFYQIRKTGRIELFKSYHSDFADGEQKRDFIYVKDCCKVICWLLEHPEVAGIYNLGTGMARSWNSLARAVFAALNLQPNIEYIDMPVELRGKYQYFTEAEMSKFREVGCQIALSSLEEGVADYVQNYLTKEYPYW